MEIEETGAVKARKWYYYVWLITHFSAFVYF